MGAWTVREKVVDARTSAASGTSVVDTILAIGSRSLDEFDALTVYLDVNTPLVGSTPTMDLYLQRAIVSDPDPTNDDHWDDMYAFPEVTTGAIERIVSLPLVHIITTISASTASASRGSASLGSDILRVGLWGDRLRIVEKMGGTVTTEAVYDITITGHLRIAN